MSVTVSHVSGTSTGSTELWGHDSHSHYVPNSDYEVPSFAEHKALESRVVDLAGDLSKIEQRTSVFQQKIKNGETQLQEVKNQLAALQSKIESAILEIRETGCIATAYKSVTDKHFANIQKVVDVLSLKIKDGELKLKTKASEGVEQLKKLASEILVKIREAEQTVAACAKKSKDDVGELEKIKEQAVSALKNAAALVQKQLSEYITGEASRLNTIEQSVLKSVDSIKESGEKVAELQDATDRLESRLKLIEKEDTLGRLAVMEKNYRETLAACQDTLSAANYFRSVNRSFFSRLWWCLTGRCNEAQ